MRHIAAWGGPTTGRLMGHRADLHSIRAKRRFEALDALDALAERSTAHSDACAWTRDELHQR